MIKKITLLFLITTSISCLGQINSKLQLKIDQQIKSVEPSVIEWRRHFHQYPELSNRETKTGAFIADYLRSIGIEVHYPVAHTGVVGLLRGDKPGPVLALRADMDALPVVERNLLPFASKVKTITNNSETGVMHACGHDAHMAILMGAATVLAKNRSELKGTVKFIFQPAEETLPDGEEGGAWLMVKEGVLEKPKVDAIFGLHIQSLLPSGELAYRPEGIMAAVDVLKIKIVGRGAHGATPWDGIDPVMIGSQIMVGLQTIVSRQTNLTKAPAVITVGSIHAGNSYNIIPEEADLLGTIRSFDLEMRRTIHNKIKLTAEKIAESAGARAEVEIIDGSPLTYNNPKLTALMSKSLERTAETKIISPTTMAEDFSFYQEKVPGLFFFLGAYPADVKLEKPPVHHTADFMLDEKAFSTGVKAFVNLTFDYMNSAK
jgi:amidohydrolase